MSDVRILGIYSSSFHI